MDSTFRFTVRLALIACGVVAFTVGAAGQKGGKGGGRQTDTPVTSTLAEYGSGFHVTDEGLGSYDSSDGVESIIQTSNTCCQDWELDTGSSTIRGIWLDFSDAVPNSVPDGSDPVSPFGPSSSASVHGRLLVQCSAVSVSFPGMLKGAENAKDCPLLIRFPIPGTSREYWRLAMHPAAPNTDLAHVACVEVDISGACNEWTITSKAGGNVARLLKISVKGNTAPVDYGKFLMTFSITVTKP